MITKSTCFLFLLNWMLCLILKNSVQILNSWLSGKKVKPFVTTTNKTLESYSIIKHSITTLTVLVYKKSGKVKPFVTTTNKTLERHTIIKCFITMLPVLVYKKSALTTFICYSLGGYNNNTKFLLSLLLLKLLLCQKKQYFLWIWGFFQSLYVPVWLMSNVNYQIKPDYLGCFLVIFKRLFWDVDIFTCNVANITLT